MTCLYLAAAAAAAAAATPAAFLSSAVCLAPSLTSWCATCSNLAVDVNVAGLRDASGKSLADNIKYTLGSKWAPVTTAPQTFSAVSDLSLAEDDAVVTAVLASAQFTPPKAPEVFTAFLMGSKAFGYSLLPQLDAPETGPCKPS
eukprot:COSAG05_NODE_552_length_8725_cov_166.636796_6_plen_144_part_00